MPHCQEMAPAYSTAPGPAELWGVVGSTCMLILSRLFTTLSHIPLQSSLECQLSRFFKVTLKFTVKIFL